MMRCFSNIWLVLFFSTQALGQALVPTPSAHDLHFDRLPTSWDEGIPLGNGMLGALIWQKDGNLRISIDRADLWDLRPMQEMYDPSFTWPWVIQKVREKDYAPVQKMGDEPYEREPAPTKIPAGALEFPIAGFGPLQSVHLYVRDAVCEISWENGTKLQAWVRADTEEGELRFLQPTQPVEARLVAPNYSGSGEASPHNSVEGQSLLSLGYPPSQLEESATGDLSFRQEGWGGFAYEVRLRPADLPDGGRSYRWRVVNLSEEKPGDDGWPATGPGGHLLWWREFWEKSSISLPDKALEKQWYLEQYKFGCAARSQAPPISLQAVWTADNGQLPPWKGDFHHDLNTQLSYWPAYSANHLAEEMGYLNWLDANRPAFEAYTRRYFQAPGINVPGVTTLRGEPMGGWIQYSMSPTISAWLGQHFYLHWRYSMDREFLEKRAYPWLSDVAVFLEKITVKDGKGMRRLPISSSPEIHDNSLEAWFLDNTNYDLALMRFGFEKAAELALELGKVEEAAHWKELLGELPDFARSEEGGLLFAPGEPYAEPHRHFSHLMAWHPLGLLDWSNEADRLTLSATLADLEKYGAGYWVGYSFAWLGNLYARARDGEKAAATLRQFAQCFCLPNTFHVNGDQCGGLTQWHYRPFTLEGNFAFAAGIQEMLLQSHTGVIEVFPAIPADWQNLGFENLRAEGAVLVSAKMEKGSVVEIALAAERSGTVRLRNVFAGGVFKPVGPTKFLEDGSIEFDMKAGERIVLRP